MPLRTNARQYQHAHELPGWYAHLSAVTPESVWTSGSSPDDFRERCKQLGGGPAVLRDYSKSMKHYWHEAAFIPDVAEIGASSVPHPVHVTRAIAIQEHHRLLLDGTRFPTTHLLRRRSC